MTSGVMRPARPSPESGSFLFILVPPYSFVSTRLGAQMRRCTHHQCEKVSRPKRESLDGSSIEANLRTVFSQLDEHQ